MTSYDVFNGDADGICALQQLRLQSPKKSILVTGLKRDIALLALVPAKSDDEITILDISLDTNRDALDKVLEAGASVFYADHHYSGEIPEHEHLTAHIDPAADTCTSLIVNRYLEGAQARWAIVGTFGDNFDQLARELGSSLGIDVSELKLLQQLGICLNYNGYGFELDDLMYHPARLFEMLHPFRNPLEFIQEAGYQVLLDQYRTDMQRSADASPDSADSAGAIYLLPNECWARRIVGVMGNDLAKRHPQRAHALLIDRGDGHYRVSVRAPYNRKEGADDLCRQFSSGGGRKAAAGINQLAHDTLAEFSEKFYSGFGVNA
ncbi:MAG: hypothetical protein IIB69_12675 [Proteobacteria bacterium]|nr:hypothetical protein [Pseudomonadota bacterium]